MIVTEQEAATKACVVTGGQSFGPGGIHDPNAMPIWKCVGSRCMAWRQEDDGKRKVVAGTTIRKDDGTMEYLAHWTKADQNAPSDPGWVPVINEDGRASGYIRSGTPLGFCGMAGKP